MINAADGPVIFFSQDWAFATTQPEWQFPEQMDFDQLQLERQQGAQLPSSPVVKWRLEA